MQMPKVPTLSLFNRISVLVIVQPTKCGVECGDLSPLPELCGDESPHSTNSLELNDDQGPDFICWRSRQL